jgi:hypothetical protein
MSGVQDQILGEIADAQPSDGWRDEVAFSTWLADNLARLGAALDVGDLDPVGTEQSVGDFRCDIVAKEAGPGGRVVVIENQFGRTDHDHLGKLLTYAAHHGAEIVVWISPTIREEHRAAIDWLNKVTSEKIGFFAVQLRVIRIDNSRPAPLFDIRSSPNNWTKPPAALAEPVSPRQELYREFFQKLIDELRSRNFSNAKKALPQRWYFFGSGTGGLNYSAEFASQDRLRTGIYIDTRKGAESNKAVFDFLKTKQAYIESKLGFNLEWERLDTKKSCRITVSRHDSSIDQVVQDPGEARKWVVDKLFALKQAFGPLLPSAVSAAEALAAPSEPTPDAMDPE